MIDTDKYEGHTPAPWRGQVDTDGKTEFDEYGSVWKGKDVIALVDDQACDEMFPDADLNLIADAPLLLEAVKHLRMIYEELYLDWRKVWDILDNMGMAKEMRQHFPNTFADTMEMIE